MKSHSKLQRIKIFELKFSYIRQIPSGKFLISK